MSEQIRHDGRAVNQQMLSALKRMVEVCESPDFDGAPSLSALNKANAAIAAAESAQAQLPADGAVLGSLLPADDMKNLRRFAECCEDFESGGHDVPKADMKRLELAGAVRSIGFGRHETTLFGDATLAAHKAQEGK